MYRYLSVAENIGFISKRTKSISSPTANSTSLPLGIGLYIYIGTDPQYGFCDIISIYSENGGYKASSISSEGYGRLEFTSEAIAAGIRAITIDETEKLVYFRNYTVSMNIFVAKI